MKRLLIGALLTMAFPNALMVEQATSPRLREDENYKYVERVYQVSGRLTEQELIQGEYIPPLGYVDDETGAVYVGHRYDSAVGYPVVTLEFRQRLAPDAVYEIHNSSYECPIEQDLLGNFLMKWKYNMYSTGTTTVPAWAATASDFSDTVGQSVYLWSTSPSGEYKTLVQSATKPGVTSYIKQTSVITKRKVYTDITEAQEWVGEVGYLCTPAQTFGLATNTEYWLIRDVRLVEDNGAYAVTVEWLFSDFGWDTDLYGTASITDDGY